MAGKEIQTISCRITSEDDNESQHKQEHNDTKTAETEQEEKYPAFVRKFNSGIRRHKRKIEILVKLGFLLGYCIYFGFAIRYSARTGWSEESWRLVWLTCLFAVALIYKLIRRRSVYLKLLSYMSKGINEVFSGQSGRINRIFWYVTMTGFIVVYLVVFVAMRRPENLQSLLGLFGFSLILFLYSNNWKKINWHTVFWGMSLQFAMALFVLKTDWGSRVFRWLADRILEYIKISHAGSQFLFGDSYGDHSIAFGATIQVIALIVGISILNYLGVIAAIVNTVGRVFAFCIDTTAPEGIYVTSTILLSVPTTILLVQRYIHAMPPSQLFVTYASVLATIESIQLILYINIGIDASNLLAASAMSAPAALAACKLVFPSYSGEVVPTCPDEINSQEKHQMIRQPKSLMDSVSLGIQQSVQVIVQGLAFYATALMGIEFMNRTVSWFGDRVGFDHLTMESILSYAFYPVAFMFGVPPKDCLFIGQLLGIRTVSIGLVAYQQFVPIIKNGVEFRDYINENVNNTWETSGRDIFLVNRNITLDGGVIERRSEIIAIYALCSSATLATLGLMVGIMTVLIPSRAEEVSNNIFRAFVVGTLASYMTACFAGLLYEDLET